MTREELVDLTGDEELLFLDPADTYDKCIIGVADRIGMETVVAYDEVKIIETLAEEMEDSEDPATDALEHFSYNIIGGYVGEKTPVFVTVYQGENSQQEDTPKE